MKNSVAHWALVTIGAWFAALALLGYVGGSILPWDWTANMRAAHLAVQFILIGAYASLVRPKGNRS